MNPARQTRSANSPGALRALVLAVLAAGLYGCVNKPNQANIALRREIQDLQGQLDQLNRRHEADVATIRSLQQQATTVPVLPQERIESLFTVHGIRFGRLTGGVDLDPSRPGDEAIKVYVVPIDATGDELKSAGSFVVEAFDLSKPADNRIGRCEFTVEQARENWFGSALLYEYVLTCPLQDRPEHSQITLKVTFRDELTQRQFTQQKVVTVRPQ